MTLSLEKYRLYPPGQSYSFRPNLTYQYPHFPPFADRSSPTMTIPNYMLDGSDYTFDLMEFNVVGTGYLQWGIQIDRDNAYLRMGFKIENGVMSADSVPVSYYLATYAMGYHYTNSSFNANIYTQKSKNLTTRIRILNLSSFYSRQIIFAVALNGPTQGNKYKFQVLPSIPYPPVPTGNPYVGGYSTYYLPDHPAGAPDKVYYGLVSLFGGIYYNISWYNPDLVGAGTQTERVAAISEVIDKNSGLPA